MARVHYRKARKDYPAHGIVKGDMYYFAQIKTGPRSSQTIRSKEPIPQSRLTTSPFKSLWCQAEEAFDAAQNDEGIAAAAELIREAGGQADEAYMNMPENLQSSETGYMLEERRDRAESAADELDELAERWLSLEEPNPLDFDRGEDDEEYANAVDEYESEQDDILQEAQGILGDMPE